MLNRKLRKTLRTIRTSTTIITVILYIYTYVNMYKYSVYMSSNIYCGPRMINFLAFSNFDDDCTLVLIF